MATLNQQQQQPYGYVSTNTSCPFPYLPPPTCNITYGQAQSSLFFYSTIIKETINIFIALIFVIRLMAEILFVVGTNKSTGNLRFIFWMTLPIALSTTSIDRYFFFGVIPYSALLIILQTINGLVFWIMAMLTDRWSQLAARVQTNNNQSTRAHYLPMKTIACVLFVVCGILPAIHLAAAGTSGFWILKSLMSGLSALFTFIYVVFATTRIYFIHQQITQNSGTLQEKNHRRVILRQLSVKFIISSICAMIIGVLDFSVFLQAVTDREYTTVLPFTEVGAADYIQMVIEVTLFILAYFFFPNTPGAILHFKQWLFQPTETSHLITTTGRIDVLMDSDAQSPAQLVGKSTLSVFLAKSLPVNSAHVLVQLPLFVVPFITFMRQHRWSRLLLSVTWSFILATFVGLIILNIVPVELGYLFSLFTVVGSMAVYAMTMSRVLLVELFRTSFFWGVFATSFVNSVLLGIALHDTRASIVPGLFAVQSIVFCSDALVIPHLRSLLIMNSLSPSFVLIVLVIFNLAPLHNEILPIGSSGYSLLQTLRDALLVHVLQMTTELLFVWRGRDRRRFLHLSESVELRIVPFADPLLNVVGTRQSAVVGHHQREGNASTIVGQSGFFARLVSGVGGGSPPAAVVVGSVGSGSEDVDSVVDHPKTKVFVNKIAVKQRDCVAVRVFGLNDGQRLFVLLDGGVGRGLLYMCRCVVLGLTCAMPWLETSAICLVVIPLLIYVIIQELMTSSVSLLRLLVRRVTFWPQILFVVVWMVLASFVLQNERGVIVLFAFVEHVFARLSDAQATIRSKNVLVRLVHSLRGSIIILVLSVYLICDQFRDVGHAVLTIAGSSSTSASTSQGAETIDFSQQCGDWGLFSLALPEILGVVMDVMPLLVAPKDKFVEKFTFINSPIAPNYNNSTTSSIVEPTANDNLPVSKQELFEALSHVAVGSVVGMEPDDVEIVM
jgi:hypothetical protein